jgi:hypothetical protein
MSTGFISSLCQQQQGEFFDQRCTQFWPPCAAILGEEQGQRAQRVEVGTVDDGAALPLRRNEFCAGQDREMSRHGILWHVELPSNFARR